MIQALTQKHFIPTKRRDEDTKTHGLTT